MALQFGSRPRPTWNVGVISFRGPTGSDALALKLGARPSSQKTFYGFEESPEQPYVYEAVLGGCRIVLVARCLWGGPQTAILVEELACLGAAAAACGVKAVWVGHISDSLATPEWESWQRPIAMTDLTVAVTMGLLEELSMTGGRSRTDPAAEERTSP